MEVVDQAVAHAVVVVQVVVAAVQAVVHAVAVVAAVPAVDLAVVDGFSNRIIS